MDIIRQYLFYKARYKILERRIEELEHDYTGRGKAESQKLLKAVKKEYEEEISFIAKYENVLECMEEEEKFFIRERYYNEIKIEGIEGIAVYYKNNLNKLEKLLICINRKPRNINKMRLKTIESCIYELRKKTLKKLTLLMKNNGKQAVN